ncbi:MAG: efflux RND transporter periplasmic adaptor subunit [Bacteroidia bacterium]
MKNMRCKEYILFLVTILVWSCNQSKESITPEIKNITESVYASGIIKSVDQYEVFSKQSGIIEKIFVEEGSSIKKGDTLLILKSENADLTKENARLSSENSKLKVNSDKLNEAESAINLTEKKLANDSLLFVRQKNLWSQGIGSKIELEQKELSFQNSKLNLLSARTRRNELKRQLTLASKQSENNLEISKLLGDDFIIRSEVDGVIYKLNNQVGELINSMSPLAVVGSKDFIIELSIDENDIVKIRNGQELVIRMDSYSSKVFDAVIVSIEPMMNSRTRSFIAEAQFVQKPPTLFPNLTVEANIVIKEKQNALTIPRKYLVNDSMVVIEGGKLQSVKVGLMDYSLVEIIEGIDTQTRIELSAE